MKTPYCKLSHVCWKKAIKRIKKKKRYEDPLQPLGEYPHFLFHVCVDLIAATGTRGAHLDTHICVCAFEAARNCASECVIKRLKRTVVRCVKDSSRRHMTTGHAALSFRSVAAPARQWSTEGDNWSLQFAVNMAGGRSRAEAAHHWEHRGCYWLPCQITVCAWSSGCVRLYMCFYACGIATEHACICTSMCPWMSVEMRLCLLTIDIVTTGPNLAQHRGSAAPWSALFVLFFFPLFLIGQKKLSTSESQDQRLWEYLDSYPFIRAYFLLLYIRVPSL